MQQLLNFEKLRFDGEDYAPTRDNVRLGNQILRVFNSMKDGEFRTLSEIEKITGDPQASISAQLRHLRKKRFGGHTVYRNYISDGLYKYKLVVNSGFI